MVNAIGLGLILILTAGPVAVLALGAALLWNWRVRVHWYNEYERVEADWLYRQMRDGLWATTMAAKAAFEGLVVAIGSCGTTMAEFGHAIMAVHGWHDYDDGETPKC